VPVEENVRLNDPPGAIEPEFHAPASATDVCVTLSLFIHITVVPAVTVSGFAPNAVVVNVDAPLGIVAEAVGLDGDVVEVESLQAAAERIVKVTSRTRIGMIRLPSRRLAPADDANRLPVEVDAVNIERPCLDRG
jgi:hypothetical protein